MKWIIMGLSGAILPIGIALANDAPHMTNEKDRINYSVGYQIGGDFKKQGVELAPEILVEGIKAALEGKQPRLAPDEMRTTLQNLKKKITADQEKEKKQAVKEFRADGEAFLKENAGKEGVVSLPSGLQYKVLKKGAGKMPTGKDTVTVNYRATLIDGTEFDSSYRDGKPATIPLTSVIAGWKEALPLMKEGSRWLLYIPYHLAFGEKGPLADRTVIYEIELVAVKPDA